MKNVKIFSVFFLVLFCILEVSAVVDFFQFPNSQEVSTGIAFSIIGGIFFLMSIYFYRKSKQKIS